MSGGHIKGDEIELMTLVTNYYGCRLPEELYEHLGHGTLYPRGYYILEKWERKGWWDYGVTLRTGWLTTKGKLEMPVILEQGRSRLAKLGLLAGVWFRPSVSAVMVKNWLIQRALRKLWMDR